MKTLNVGIIGTGNIAPAYIRGCAPFGVIKMSRLRRYPCMTAREAFAAEHSLEAIQR